jgi:hypothetical protein
VEARSRKEQEENKTIGWDFMALQGVLLVLQPMRRNWTVKPWEEK